MVTWGRSKHATAPACLFKRGVPTRGTPQRRRSPRPGSSREQSHVGAGSVPTLAGGAAPRPTRCARWAWLGPAAGTCAQASLGPLLYLQGQRSVCTPPLPRQLPASEQKRRPRQRAEAVRRGVGPRPRKVLTPAFCAECPPRRKYAGKAVLTWRIYDKNFNLV